LRERKLRVAGSRKNSTVELSQWAQKHEPVTVEALGKGLHAKKLDEESTQFTIFILCVDFKFSVTVPA
jgi:hypothetical protein